MGLILNPNISAIDLLLKENINLNWKENIVNLPTVLILNLMPIKKNAEVQLLRLLGNSFMDIKVDFLYTSTYKPKNTEEGYLRKSYKTLEEVQNTNYDGMIITGAPLEFLDFDEIKYWTELKEIMDYSCKKIKSTIYLCWGAAAGLYYHYNISKHITQKKVFGVFSHRITDINYPLFKGYDEKFMAPHSRYLEIKEEDINRIKELEILSKSKEAGIYMVAKKNGQQIFIMGHPEYDEITLKEEYERDLNKGLSPSIPKNYFPQDNPKEEPRNTWKHHTQLLIDNWIKEYLL
ncbi:homoserine O-succinyltransferase [Tissierella sp. MSJ-40]|uniref:Homoserine O-acetyltransferase n=1 Tax=Tissierella simiarum TaxID=2841534 RepID=A0ABS6E4C2_9FIRM|nr:homoserine O-succinyltransferase [Tissierella simiarum]MBU5437108.1 homoserine O-succinyltransferase [Tissierella simiarum]